MSFTENKKIMVYVESKENKAVQAGLEVLTPAKELANEVIAGKWGNGQERKDKLGENGY